jgi:oligopeptide/dipeptide ABC transporter ATP-binding protein
MTPDVLLQARGVCKYFSRQSGWWGRHSRAVRAVEQVDVDVQQGETLALVGESGSGKTTLAKTLIRLYVPTAGSITLEGRDIARLTKRQLQSVRQHVQMVFQDPTSSLNPRRTVYDTIALPLQTHLRLSRAEQRRRIEELLDAVDLPGEFMHRYPHTLSGGQKQRVGIARALALHPRLVVLDEPTSALDVSVQAKILELLLHLKRQFALTYIYISHDLHVVRNIADRTAVMYLGRIVEAAPTAALFRDPLHPYTRALLSAIPVVSAQEAALLPEEITLAGEIPSPTDVTPYCVFRSRCPKKLAICESEPPPLLHINAAQVHCHLYSHAPLVQDSQPVQ